MDGLGLFALSFVTQSRHWRLNFDATFPLGIKQEVKCCEELIITG
jgi:hypothetical protein